MSKLKNYKLYCHEFTVDNNPKFEGWETQDLCYRLKYYLTKKFELSPYNYRDNGNKGICIVHENESKIDELGAFFNYLVDDGILEKLIKTYFSEDSQYNHEKFNQDLDLAYKGCKSLELSNEINLELPKRSIDKQKIKI